MAESVKLISLRRCIGPKASKDKGPGAADKLTRAGITRLVLQWLARVGAADAS